jgi:ubiquinone/menaquinone biosynthesis C-methylase UbiE
MKTDSQYYVLDPDSYQVRLATKQRRVMYHKFVEELRVAAEDSILDVGVTSDQTFENSNYLEAWHPHPERITAVGLDDASFLVERYQGLTFLIGDGLRLPFRNRSFDYVHCSAVIEHVGSMTNQKRLIAECARVARKGFFITTPNRWFPIEVHTSLPLFHWLPKRVHRAILRALKHEFYSTEENLNLMSCRELIQGAAELSGFNTFVLRVPLFGWTSNLMLTARRTS